MNTSAGTNLLICCFYLVSLLEFILTRNFNVTFFIYLSYKTACLISLWFSHSDTVSVITSDPSIPFFSPPSFPPACICPLLPSCPSLPALPGRWRSPCPAWASASSSWWPPWWLLGWLPLSAMWKCSFKRARPCLPLRWDVGDSDLTCGTGESWSPTKLQRNKGRGTDRKGEKVGRRQKELWTEMESWALYG